MNASNVGHMLMYSRVPRAAGALDNGQEITYEFDLISRAKVLHWEYGYPFCGYRYQDFKYVRELYRYTDDDKTKTLVQGPTDKWQSEWAQCNMMPPFTYEELRRPTLAISRLNGSKPALELWLEKIEPRYTNDPDYYPADWKWRVLYVYERDQRCRRCNALLASPVSFGEHGHTHHIEDSGGRRTHALDNLLLLCKECHLKQHGKETFQRDYSRYTTFRVGCRRLGGFAIRIILRKKDMLPNIGDVVDIVGGTLTVYVPNEVLEFE
jgi:hypothetical protein